MIDTTLFFVSIAVIIAIGYILYKIRPVVVNERRMRGFFLMSIAVMAWIAVAAVALLASPEYYSVAYSTKVAFAIIVTYLAFWFILNFTESKYLTSRVVKIYLVSAASIDLLSLFTTSLHKLYFVNLDYPETTNVPPTSILFWINLAIRIIGVLFFFLQLYKYIVAHFRHYPLLIALGVGVVIPFALNIMYVFNAYGLNRDISPLGYFFTIILFAFFSYSSLVRNYSSTYYRDSMATITKSPVLYSGPLEDAIAMIANEGCKAIDVQCITIWKFSDDMSYITKTMTFSTGVRESATQNIINLSNSPLYKKAIETEQIFIVNDISMMNALSGATRDYNPSLCAYMDSPIRVGGELFGIIRIEQHRCQTYPERREWTTMEQSYIATLASFVSVALENTERHRLEDAIVEANKRTTLMLNTSPISTQLWNKDNALIDYNDAAIKLYGYQGKQEADINEFIEKTSPEFQPDGQRSYERSQYYLNRAFDDGFIMFEWMHTFPETGAPLPTEVTLVRAENEAGEVVIAYTRDLREHNKMMDSIRQRDKLLMAVNQVASMLLTTQDSEDVEENIMASIELVGRATNVDRVHIWKNEVVNGKLYHICIYLWQNEEMKKIEKSFKGSKFAFEEGPQWGETLMQNECISGALSNRPLREQEFLKKHHDLKALVVIPLFLDDQFWGFFSVDDCETEREFTKEEISILRSVSLMMASAINRHALIAKRTHEAELLTAQKYEYASKLREALGKITKSPTISAGDLEAAIAVIAKIACEALSTSVVGYKRLLPNGSSIESVVIYTTVRGISYTRQVFDMSDSETYSDMLKSERLIVINSISEMKKILPGFVEAESEMCALLDAPIYIDGKLTGVLCIEQNKTEVYVDGREWISEEQSFASSLADLMSVAISGYERRKARDEAELASQTKSLFLAKMSHEIRTPMNAIIGMAELALREDVNDAVREHIVTVKQAGTNLLSIINDILDFSKLESGAMQITPTEYSLSSLVNDVISIIRIKAFDSQIRFAVNIDSNIPDSLTGDEVRIRQVLINILGNAVKFTDSGHVLFSINGKNIEKNKILLTIDIEDSGRGIKQEDIEKLFEDYYQTDDEKRESEGTGLGLAISRNIINAMDGDITIKSVFGEGSTFTITLPQEINKPTKLATVDNPEERTVLFFERRTVYVDSIKWTLENLGVTYRHVATEEAFLEEMSDNFVFVFVSHYLFEKNKRKILDKCGNSQIVLLTEFGDAPSAGRWNALSLPAHAISIAAVLNRMPDSYSYSYSEKSTVRFSAPDACVLIVDDISTNLKVANGLLLPFGMKVDMANSGYEAIDMIKEKQYDLVFMDHRMPGIDGVETTAMIREMVSEDSYYGDVPIVALTANAVSGMKEMFMQNGFNEFMSKPIDVVKLSSVLEKFIPKEKQLAPVVEKKKSTDKDGDKKITITGVDVEKGIMLTGGTIEYYMETLATFYIDGQKRVDEIAGCLVSEDISMYITNVHAMKSASANIGAKEVSDRAMALEIAAIDNDMDFVKSNNDPFLDELQNLLENIYGALLAHSIGSKSEESDVDAEECKKLLSGLKEALESYEIDTINSSIDSLLRMALTDNVLAVVREISKHILIVEYDEAIVLIDRLLAGEIGSAGSESLIEGW